MLCTVCHRQIRRTDSRCRSCGTPRDRAVHLDLVLAGGERVPLDRPLTIGRAPASEIRLEDPSVSRAHAEILVAGPTVMLRDTGSSYGTFVDGRRLAGETELAPGMRIELGDCLLEVAERDDTAAAHHTVSVPAGISLVVEQPRIRRARMRGYRARRPRLRSGWSLKRVQETDGEHYVLKEHRSSRFVRLGVADAELVPLLDGERDLVELVGEAAERCGADGPGQLARLLAELADRGLLAEIDAAAPSGSGGLLSGAARWLRPRERTIPGVPAAVAAVYRRGGYLLFTIPGLALLTAVALAGLAAFATLIIGRDAAPFVVAQRVGLGALVFVLGRLLLVVCHELAHGLVAESFGRPVSRAGIKVAFVFPYVFMDTTDAWFEPRRRRIAISLAGPGSDLVVGGGFAVGCWLAAPGSLRDVLFQVAFGGYVGALLNLNPLMERDGYHALVDVLRRPGLRRRASRRLAQALSGTRPRGDGRGLLAYAVAALVWSALTVAFAVVLSLRYYHALVALAPAALVWTLLSAFYLVLALPLAAQLLRPLWTRVYRPRPVL